MSLLDPLTEFVPVHASVVVIFRSRLHTSHRDSRPAQPTMDMKISEGDCTGLDFAQ